nr:AIPR family protein [Nannocystis sp. SCPEA4]
MFSANIRGYLGVRDTDENINNGIKSTAVRDPSKFWAYNNGLTALVHRFEFDPDSPSKLLVLHGLSVVNGAQTTGAIGNIPDDISPDAMVSIRFVRTTDTSIVHNIIRYNNSQNRVNASDFRSNDKIQRRLRDQFKSLDPDIVYPGGRRGGESDAMARSKKDYLIPSDSAAQALAAFHQEPGLAYLQKGQIWEDNETYHRFFNDKTTASHIVFVFSLLRAVEKAKSELRERAHRNEMTEINERAYNFFLGRGATYLLIAAIGKCLETFAKKRIPETFRVSFGNARYQSAVSFWNPIVEISLAGCGVLQPAVDARLKDSAVKDALGKFQQLIEMTKQANISIYNEFTRKIKID